MTKEKDFVTDRQRFLLLFLTALLLRVVLIALSPWHSDLEFLRACGADAALNGITTIYEPLRHSPAPGYLPLSLYLLWFLDHAGNLLERIIPGVDGFVWAYKLFLALVDGLIGWALYRRLSDAGNSTFGAVLFLFNPGVLFCGVIWGQLDNVYALFLLVSLISLLDNRVGMAGLLFALACLTKIQAAVFAPLFLFAVMRRNAWRAMVPFSLGVLFLFVLGCLPFLLTGRMHAIVASLHRGGTLWHYLSVNAFNVWWLISGGNGFTPDTIPCFFKMTARSAGLVLFALGYLAALVTILRHEGKAGARQEDSGTVLAFVLLAIAFFMLPTRMHERCLFPVFVFLPLLPLSSLLEKGLYLLLAMSYYVNLNAVFHGHKHRTGVWTTHFSEIGMLCAAVNVLAFAVLLGMALKRRV